MRHLWIVLVLGIVFPLQAEMQTRLTPSGKLSWEAGHVQDNRIAVRVRFEANEDTDLVIIGEDRTRDTLHQTKRYAFQIPKGRVLSKVLWFPVRWKSHRWRTDLGQLRLKVTANDEDLDDIHVYLKSLAGEDIQVTLVGPRPSVLDGLTGRILNRAIPNRTQDVNVIRLAPATLPDVRYGWTGMDVVVLQDLADNALTPLQIDALEDYVLDGGSLVWIAGASSRATSLEKNWTRHGPAGRPADHGRGLVLSLDESSLEGLSEAKIRQQVLGPLISQGGLIRPRSDTGSVTQPDRYRTNHRLVTHKLFEPPSKIATLAIILGSLMSFLFVRFWSQRSGRRVFFPVTVGIVSFAWLLLIYFYGIFHHGLGTTSRSLVRMTPLDDRQVLCEESWAVITSYGSRYNYTAQPDTELVLLDDGTGHEYISDSFHHLTRAQVRIWKPTAFVAETIRPVTGRLVVQGETLANDTPWAFDGALVWRGGTLSVARDIRPGDLAPLTPLKSRTGTPVSLNRGSVTDAVLTLLDEDTTSFLSRSLKVQIKSLSFSRQQDFVLAWGNEGVTLLEDPPRHDETLVIWHDPS